MKMAHTCVRVKDLEGSLNSVSYTPLLTLLKVPDEIFPKTNSLWFI